MGRLDRRDDLNTEIEASEDSGASSVDGRRFSVEGPDVRFSIEKAPGEETAIFIPDGLMQNSGDPVSFTDLILDGKKLGETRNAGTTRFRPDVWYGIAKEGKVVGAVKFGEAKEITRDSPEYESAMIKGTNYDIPENGAKLYYPIVDTVDMRDDPKPVLRHSPRYAIYRPGNDARFSLTEGDDADTMTPTDTEGVRRDVEDPDRGLRRDKADVLGRGVSSPAEGPRGIRAVPPGAPGEGGRGGVRETDGGVQDSAGRRLGGRAAALLQGTVVVDEYGTPLTVYHATSAAGAFGRFTKAIPSSEIEKYRREYQSIQKELGVVEKPIRPWYHKVGGETDAITAEPGRHSPGGRQVAPQRGRGPRDVQRDQLGERPEEEAQGQRGADQGRADQLNTKLEASEDSGASSVDGQRFSISEYDSEDRELSPGQQYFFRNSKAVDRYGKLLRMYHGTPSMGFTTFDTSGSGGVLFFTDKRGVARSYSGSSGKDTFSVDARTDLEQFHPKEIKSFKDAVRIIRQHGYSVDLKEDIETSPTTGRIPLCSMGSPISKPCGRSSGTS